MASHSKGGFKNEFCTQRKKTCRCGAKYRDTCRPSPSGWTLKVGKRKYEAHHLICVASATAYLLRERGIRDVVQETDWCVNEDPNMLAMPLWGHVIKWYSDPKNYIGEDDPNPPAFVDVPCHNYNHNGEASYKADVDKWVMDLASQYKNVAKKDHKKKAAELAGTLKTQSEDLRTRLQNKGAGTSMQKVGKTVKAVAGSGTHASWVAAMTGNTTNWYEPFSMAAKAKPRDFPLGKGKVSNLQKRVKALLGI